MLEGMTDIDKSQLEKLALRLPDAEEETLIEMLEDSKSICLNKLYPFKEYLPIDLPPKYLNWQIRVCKYMYKHADFLGIISYEENELKIKFSSDNIPKSYMDEIVPYAGAISHKRHHCHKKPIVDDVEKVEDKTESEEDNGL